MFDRGQKENLLKKYFKLLWLVGWMVIYESSTSQSKICPTQMKF